MQEKRKYLRKPLAVILELLSRGSHKTIGRGFITNLSEGGAALETSHNLRLGDKLMLHFNLPDESEYSLPGEIVYTIDGILTRAYGARFLQVDPQAEERLKEYLIGRVRV